MPVKRPAARPITHYGAAVLHRPCAPVETFDAALAELIDAMFTAMYAVRGVGLAANQIGVGLRVFVYDCVDARNRRHVGHVVNPVLQAASALAGSASEPEGCLSVPGVSATLARSALATVTGVDRTGAAVSVSGTGYFARCLQHEAEHLDGIVYVDHLPEPERRRLLREAGLG